MSREEDWGTIFYDPTSDEFVARICRNNGEVGIVRPLSVTCRFGGFDSVLRARTVTLDREAWRESLRRLHSWGVLRAHFEPAEIISRGDLEWLVATVQKIGLTPVFSVAEVPQDLAEKFPSGVRLHVPLEPATYQEQLPLLHACSTAGHHVRAITVFDPANMHALQTMASDLLIHDVKEWTFATPPSSAERVWLPPEQTPETVRQIRDSYRRMKIDFADVRARENNLILLEDATQGGGLFTQDFLATNPQWLVWLKLSGSETLTGKHPFSYERHLDLWIGQRSKCQDPSCRACRPPKDVAAPRTGPRSRRNPPARPAPQATPSPSFDVFLAYDRADTEEVLAIAQRLRDREIRPWLDLWAVRPGRRWQAALAEQIDRIPAMALFIGSRGSKAKTFRILEQDAFLSRFKTSEGILIPVLLSSCKSSEELDAFLRTYRHIDFRQTEPDPFELLVWGITGSSPNP